MKTLRLYNNPQDEKYAEWLRRNPTMPLYETAIENDYSLYVEFGNTERILAIDDVCSFCTTMKPDEWHGREDVIIDGEVKTVHSFWWD